MLFKMFLKWRVGAHEDHPMRTCAAGRAARFFSATAIPEVNRRWKAMNGGFRLLSVLHAPTADLAMVIPPTTPLPLPFSTIECCKKAVVYPVEPRVEDILTETTRTTNEGVPAAADPEDHRR
jgi:hypothetical protein